MNAAVRQDWLDERRTVLGASDSPAVCRVDPFKTRLKLFLDKTGELPVAEEESEAMLWGDILEPVIAAEVSRRHGVRLTAWRDDQGRPLILRHPTRPWMAASLDYITDDGAKPVQIKTTSAFMGREWGDEDSDEIPAHVLVQVHHEMEVAGVDVCGVAVLIGGQRLKWYPEVRKSVRLTENMLRLEEEFWEMVQQRIPPEPTDKDLKLIKRMRGTLPDTIAHINDPDFFEKAKEFHAIRMQRLGLEKVESRLEAELREAASKLGGGAETLVLPDSWTMEISTRQQHRRAQPEKFVPQRTFRVKPPKWAQEA